MYTITTDTPIRYTTAPRPRLTVDGYTKIGGSPVAMQAQYAGRWRRVYTACFGTGASYFVWVKGEPHWLPRCYMRFD